MMHENSVKTSQ